MVMLTKPNISDKYCDKLLIICYDWLDSCDRSVIISNHFRYFPFNLQVIFKFKIPLISVKFISYYNRNLYGRKFTYLMEVCLDISLKEGEKKLLEVSLCHNLTLT